jgi:2'-5' RNA ligase
MAFFIARTRLLPMAAEKSLYLIALVPDADLRSRIRSLKEEMKQRFGAKHALKSPAHITLQMPFRRPASFESELFESLESLAHRQGVFELPLKGFDCFPPRVLFVKVENQEAVRKLHRQLQKILKEALGFGELERRFRFHPHMTIATRDLTQEAFQEAWPEFAKRGFEALFQVKSLFLLKHNGKTWDCYREFPFGGVETG